jgi:hypothetical protein
MHCHHFLLILGLVIGLVASIRRLFYHFFGGRVFLLMLALSSSLLAEDRVRIRVDQPMVLAGRPFNVYCTVPRHPDNRKLKLEVELIRSREEDLEGANERQTFGLFISRAECLGVLKARCRLSTSKNTQFSASQDIEVRGCAP